MKLPKIALVTALVSGIILVFACNTPTSENNSGADTIRLKAEQERLQSLDTANSCAKPTKYPNQDKPMALMMRQMADNAQKMKDLVLAGKAITANEFPFIRFHLVEPTDPDVLQPQFYENARLLQEAHKNMINAPVAKQKELYTAYINQCISCHQVYCSGPLKRIKKLTLDYNQ